MEPEQRANLRHETEIDGQVVQGGVMQSLVDQALGAQHLTSYRLTITPGSTVSHLHPGVEEALYVVAGMGEIRIAASSHTLCPGQAAFVPAGAEHHYTNTGDAPMILVGAMVGIGPFPLGRQPIGALVMDEAGVAPTLMGERSFRVLISPSVGCQTMTQFTGVIPTGRAPLHAHPHEEAVYILAGTGRLWIEDEVVGVLRPGSVVFFPIGIRHILENSGRGDLKVLGAFSPAGSPDAKRTSAG